MENILEKLIRDIFVAIFIQVVIPCMLAAIAVVGASGVGLFLLIRGIIRLFF